MPQNQVSDYAEITGIIDADSLSFTLMATEPLVQYLKKGTSDGFMPNWATSDRKPVIYPNAMSQLEGIRKQAVAGSEEWSYNGTVMTFNASGVSVTPAVIAGTFQKQLYNNGDFLVPALKIIGNLVSPTNVDTDQIGMSCKVEVSGIQIPASNSISIRLEETVGDPYQGFISATDGGVIDNNTKSVTLTAELTKGGSYVTEGITYKWFRAVLGGWEALSGIAATPNKLLVNDSMVDTFAMFKCEYWIGGLMVFSSVTKVSDETDPLILAKNPSGPTMLGKGGSVTYRPKVVRRATGTVETGYGKLSFTTFKADGTALVIPTGQIVANTSITITRTDVDNGNGRVRIHFVASK